MLWTALTRAVCDDVGLVSHFCDCVAVIRAKYIREGLFRRPCGDNVEIRGWITDCE
jgi:hypothetical protein